MEAGLTFGKWLKRRRRALDKTQKELAQQVGCALITIQKFEADERRPSKELAERLADCLGLAPEDYDQFILFARTEPYLEVVSPPVAPAASLPWTLPVAPPQSAAPEKVERYELLAPIGQGGFATVYRARDTKLDRLVALKELGANLLADAAWVDRFRREARVIARLDHPRIVAIYDVGQVEGRMFLVMRLVDGPSLDVSLSNRGRLPWSEAIEVVKVVAEGLDYAHSQGILHRDLKPANILMDPERGPLLSDFGLAKLVGENSLTQSRRVVGTPHYIAPEIWDNRPAAPQTDIYALGCILYELLTGQKLFQGKMPPAVMAAHFRPLALPETWPAGTPPDLANVLRTALAKQPDDRYATAGELVQALASLVTAEPPDANREIIMPSPLPLRSSVPLPSHSSVPFVTRERELAKLTTALATARAGQGQVLFVIGGAGRGKTMLVQEFARRAQAADPELIAIGGYCNVHTGSGDPYLPFREALTLLTGDVEAKWAGGLISQAHTQRLREAMPLTLPALVEHAPDLIESFAPGQALQERAATFAPQEAAWFSRLRSLVATEPGASLEQKRIFAQYTALLKAIAGQQPLLLIIEDLHWVDASSSDLLFHLSREVGDSRILIVGTYRPDEVAMQGSTEQHPLAGMISELKRRHGDIWLDLGDLSPMEGRRFVEAYLDTQPNRLEAAFRERLFRHTNGHALFTVELLREMQERGDLRQDKEGYWLEGARIDWQTLPAKVEGVIERRMNRLTEELQAILTVASVEGETFTAEVVARVLHLEEQGLVRQLSQVLDKRRRLITAQALERVGEQRLSLYRFRHHLFQHYLYHHLDEMEQVYLHEAVGKALESLYTNQTEQVAVQLARHFEQAGLTTKAVEYLLQAGKQAVQLSAYKEAVAHLTKGLELLKTFPTTPESMRYELDIQMTLGRALIAKGYASPEVRQAYTRAHMLCRQVGQKPELFEILGGLSDFYRTRGELQTARELAEESLDLARQMDDPFLLSEAHYTLGHSLYLIGELISAQIHLEQGLATDIPQQHRSPTFHFWDSRPYCLSRLAQVLWLLGYPEQALKKSHEALSLAQEFSRPLALVAYILNDTAEVRLLCGEGGAVQDQIDTTLKLCHEYEFRQMLAWATFLQGSALVAQGQVEQGISQQYQACEAYQAVGGKGRLSRHLAVVAEACKIRGQSKEGLRLVAEGFAVMKENGEHFYEAELYRLKGELLRQAETKAEEEIENYYLKAIEVARQQEAKSLELRAVMSLSRLWHAQGLPGKKEETQRMLAEIYGWFSEGFDTADLKEAKALLEALS